MKNATTAHRGRTVLSLIVLTILLGVLVLVAEGKDPPAPGKDKPAKDRPAGMKDKPIGGLGKAPKLGGGPKGKQGKDKSAPAAVEEAGSTGRGSLVEDRTARKLLEAGDARLDANEVPKALEAWQSVIERYPRSKVRFDAHLRLGNHLLTRDRAFDRARTHFDAVAAEDNPDESQRAEATLKLGMCFYESRNFGKCFKYMRDVIEKFPVSPQVNLAYYYIGLGHFQEGHYSRAIAALERVGTALPAADPGADNPAAVLEAGKRLFIRIEDADLAALEPGKTIPVRVESSSGDKETVECVPIGRNVRLVIGSIPSSLGKPKPGNGVLEVHGGDTVTIYYTDAHTSTGNEQLRDTKVPVIGTATAAIMDGAFSETLQGVVLGRGVNVQVVDADLDTTDGADTLKATVEVYREKSPEELAAEDQKQPDPETTPTTPQKKDPFNLDRYKKIDGLDITLTEVKIARSAPAQAVSNLKFESTKKPAETAPAPKATGESAKKAEEPEPKPEPAAKEPEPADDSIHTGIFRGVVPLERSDSPDLNDQKLHAQPNDIIVLTYTDERNATGEPRAVKFKVRCLEGNLGSVRVSQTQISDEELRIRTQLKTASALTNIGNRYKEFGLKQHAESKYKQALALCEEVQAGAKRLGGRTLEETYVQLWKVYFEMDKLSLAAAISQKLQNEFPNSEFVDAALIALGDVSRMQKDYKRAITVYTNVLRLNKSALRGEAQFGIAECYEEMAKEGKDGGTQALFDRAFQEYKKVFEQYPDSGRVGEAVAKMANYYYQQKDYARAVDTFDSVLKSHPDAKYLDVILFNYGRCLYRMEKKAEARKLFDQLLGDFPESTLAADAKKISEALRKAGF